MKFKKVLVKPEEIEEVIDEMLDDASKIKNLEPTLTTSGKMYKPQGHKGFAHGMKFDSYWEFAFYLYTTEKEGLICERNRTEKLHYIDENGKSRNFYPDFIVAGKYYEIKGFLRPSDKCKMDQCWEVEFLFGEDIKPMISWLNKNHKNWKSEYMETL